MTRLDRTCNQYACTSSVWARDMCRKHYARWHQHGDAGTVLLVQSPAGAPGAFIEALPKTGEGCIRWPYATNNAGYGQINTPGGKRLVNRLVCERVHGSPPTPQHVAAHKCGKGHEACVAPWHLSWKTQAENMADSLRHGTRRLGDQNAHKLSSVQAREIRSRRGLETQEKTAKEFGVSQTLVSRIQRGIIWWTA